MDYVIDPVLGEQLVDELGGEVVGNALRLGGRGVGVGVWGRGRGFAGGRGRGGMPYVGGGGVGGGSLGEGVVLWGWRSQGADGGEGLRKHSVKQARGGPAKGPSQPPRARVQPRPWRGPRPRSRRQQGPGLKVRPPPPGRSPVMISSTHLTCSTIVYRSESFCTGGPFTWGRGVQQAARPGAGKRRSWGRGCAATHLREMRRPLRPAAAAGLAAAPAAAARTRPRCA